MVRLNNQTLKTFSCKPSIGQDGDIARRVTFTFEGELGDDEITALARLQKAGMVVVELQTQHPELPLEQGHNGASHDDDTLI